VSAGQVVSVGQLTAYLRQLFESDVFLNDLWVEGEVSQAFPATSGHLYFSIKDATSQVKCVAFRGQVQRFRFIPRQGDQIAVHGRLSLYERDGAYQLYVDSVQSAGLGLQALQLELLRQKLTAEGLFDPARKRPIPAMPTYVGVVTSADGAVWHDIRNVMRRRFPLAELILSPTLVQGDLAPEAIVRALEAVEIDGRAQVIILARGGGSADDLATFNDERVVRAVFASTIPVVSAVGHETDWTLVDHVADLRAPTPSAAAELVSPSIADIYIRLIEYRRTMRRQIEGELQNRAVTVFNLVADLDRLNPFASLLREQARLAGAFKRSSTAIRSRLREDRLRISILGERLDRSIAGIANEQRHRLQLGQTRLTGLDPRNVMGRGYAFVERLPESQPVISRRELSPGDLVRLRFADGTADARVESTVQGAGFDDRN
jgi:exodeoxyribonuclease VII large subunit